MTDYSKMSDFEINKAVGFAVGYATCIEPYFEVVIINKTGRQFNPCNSPADAWPIIVANRIGVLPASNGDKWAAHYQEWRVAVADKNPLRAAMIVFIMIKEAENV
ncbi:hypothetical protein Eta_0034 [Serratia phage Eta]|uniref:DUF2591 domain-containing protein n=1 Tax=Serratia phage Eta TaxID=1282995 RepID=R9VYJ6_9CAUD|nr:hypothetical protein Eta_0034 [Serratia phage Eta]AGN89480.1 hypothetical protein Eta_0034 [Serratia phage Eta]